MRRRSRRGRSRRTEPDHERHLLPRADKHAGVIAMDDDEREVALELGEREPDGLDEVALVVPLDEVRDGLGVGLGGELVAFGEEALLQLAVVLDDPVQHDRQRLGSQPVSGCAFSSVTRRASPSACARARSSTGRILRRAASGCRAARLRARRRAHPPRAARARGVVAAVLEALEPLQQQRLALPRPDVSDDPAHRGTS